MGGRGLIGEVVKNREVLADLAARQVRLSVFYAPMSVAEARNVAAALLRAVAAIEAHNGPEGGVEG